MHDVITDTHFMQRDRMGRLLTFVARIALTTPWVSPGARVRAVGVSEHTVG
jgi:cyanophycinase-like exopeptidase